jgi:thymidylate kinase
MKKFIVIEGPDGSGKTTTVHNLAKKLGFVPIKTPSKKFIKIRNEYDRPGILVKDRFKFYSEGLKEDVREIQDYIKQDRGVVVDRYTLSLGIYHTEMDPNIDYMTLVDSMNFPKPDITFITISPLYLIQKRITLRNNPSSDSCLERNSEFMYQIC